MDHMVRDLSVVAKLPVHGKLCSDRSGLYVEQQLPFGVSALLRWCRRDGRRQTVHDLHTLVRRIQEKCTDVGEVPQPIADKVPAAVKGLLILKSTYGHDPVCVSEIELVIQKLEEIDKHRRPTAATAPAMKRALQP